MKPYKLHDRSSDAWKAFLKSKEPRTEHDLQVAVVNWCRSLEGAPIVRERFAAIPNGAYLAGSVGQRAHQAHKLKAEGMRAGAPDMYFYKPRTGAFNTIQPGEVMWLELKNGKKGVVSPEQKIVHADLIECGFTVVIARTLDEARAAITEFYR